MAAGALPFNTISIHPPHARWDDPEGGIHEIHDAFQSTHLMRGGTFQREKLRGAKSRFQSTHLMRGGTEAPLPDRRCLTFQSTHLMRGGTSCREAWQRLQRIFQSTHLMRGGTRMLSSWMALVRPFQSTHLMRGGTWRADAGRYDCRISIHPPHARWDAVTRPGSTPPRNFNPPTSCEVGRAVHQHQARAVISIHPPHARWDQVIARLLVDLIISIHPPHARWDASLVPPPPRRSFQSTHLMRGGTCCWPWLRR